MAAADEIHGDAGNDTIIGGPGQDNLFGESGADFLDGSGPVPAGLDTCDAGGDFGDIEGSTVDRKAAVGRAPRTAPCAATRRRESQPLARRPHRRGAHPEPRLQWPP
ncbi:Leukotoxin [Nymphon striatum]|nr:Leukotoxin [Nymphon striatum]